MGSYHQPKIGIQGGGTTPKYKLTDVNQHMMKSSFQQSFIQASNSSTNTTKQGCGSAGQHEERKKSKFFKNQKSKFFKGNSNPSKDYHANFNDDNALDDFS